ncbi:hypothetical protein M501DRAFT_922298, partial [Patellaria atrata CBS 101060]
KEAPEKPVLTEEDEAYLQRIVSEGAPPPLPDRPTVILDSGEKVVGKDAQIALMAGADQIPLPTSPPAEASDKGGENLTVEEKKKRDYWSYLPAIPKIKRLITPQDRSKERAAISLQSAADALKAGEAPTATEQKGEEKSEEDDLTSILDQLNLAAVNNRVFSFSKESQELLDKFKVVLKDLMNGIPTAYDDLEKLLTGSEKQLNKMFEGMPPFLQTLIKSLPAKMTAALGPEILAAASEKPGADAKTFGEADTSSSSKKKKSTSSGARIPSLKKLVSQQGAVASMLRAILNFLKLRFPVFMTGTNILMSLAIFILLFVFWYCHKRGREVRLEKEAARSAESASPVSSDSELSASDILEPVKTPAGEKHEPPIIINEDPAVPDKPSATVQDLPSVLDLPDPKSVALPKS